MWVRQDSNLRSQMTADLQSAPFAARDTHPKLMKYFEEMKYEDMSALLGTSVGALKASYHLAVKKIEQFFNEID